MSTPSVNLFDLASRQARWLGVRQATVAGNIANANTPGFVAKDVEPFAAVLADSRVRLAATAGGHWDGSDVAVEAVEGDPAVLPSGNTVVLEDELVKSGEVRRGMELNTAIVKAFHRMTMLSVKG